MDKLQVKINELKIIFLDVLNKLLLKLKAVTKLPYFKRYALLAAILTVLFIILSFPYEVIVLRQLQKLEGKSFSSIAVTGMNISLIGDSSAESITVILKNGDSLQINQLTADLTLNPFSLLKNKFSGEVKATSVIYDSKQIRVQCRPNLDVDIQLDESGSVPSDGEIKALINDIRITSDGSAIIGIYTLPSSIKADKINIEGNIANKTLNIKDLTVSGNDLSGKISGNIILMPILNNSKLNLKISVNSESALLDGFRPLLRQFMDESGKISILLGGTIARPKPDLNSGKGGKQGNNSNIPPFENDPEM